MNWRKITKILKLKGENSGNYIIYKNLAQKEILFLKNTLAALYIVLN